jgi:hypothetical protein
LSSNIIISYAKLEEIYFTFAFIPKIIYNLDSELHHQAESLYTFDILPAESIYLDPNNQTTIIDKYPIISKIMPK